MGRIFEAAIILVFLTLGLDAQAAPGPTTPLIDFADSVMLDRACLDCPGYVGQMIGANPITLGEIKDKSEIVVEDCHFTLVATDVVRTASHCVRRWSREWAEKAGGDCSKAYRFYFPQTARSPRESANCAEIISPIALQSGLLQLQPDDVLIRLNRHVAREFASVDPEPLRAEDEAVIWGYDGVAQEFQKRTCRRVEGSLLTPLDGESGSAYATLTCDGNLSTGWSGDGVFVNGGLKAVVSFGLGQTTFGTSFFGENEVAISQASCSFSGPQPLPAACLPSTEYLDLRMHDRYASAIDLAGTWHDSTQEIILGHAPYVELEYGHGAATLKEFSFTPEYRARCFRRDLLPPDGRVLTRVSFRMETFLPRFVIFNPDTTVAGVSRRDPQNPSRSIGEFNIGLLFHWGELKREGPLLTIDGKPIPYCE